MAKSAVKLVYYYAFATLYGLAGGWANVRRRTVFCEPALGRQDLVLALHCRVLPNVLQH